MLRILLPLALIMVVTDASAATQCRLGDMQCLSEMRSALRPGNGHYQAEQRRYGLQPQNKQCGTRPYSVGKNSMANDPACAR